MNNYIFGLILLIELMATRPEPENPFVLASKAAAQGKAGSLNYLLPQIELRRVRSVYSCLPVAEIYWQAMATYASLADETDSAAFYWQRLEGNHSTVRRFMTKGQMSTLPTALPIVLAQTIRHKIVMFNEEHTQPRGRWLLGSLLPTLYKQGFRYLALEALDPVDSIGLRQRGYPIVGSGFYTNEPHFGNLIRRAQQLGFHIIAYESKAADRDQGQARNLLMATLRLHPQARVLVLAGHAHINEGKTQGSLSMAQWIRELSGIDPLTIEQTQAVNTDLPEWQKLPPGVYLVNSKMLSNQAINSDLYLLNNLRLGRMGNGFGGQTTRLIVLKIPTRNLHLSQAQLLVYLQHERNIHLDAEPVLVRCLWYGESTTNLALLPGTYTVVLNDAFGQERWRRTLLVQPTAAGL